MPAVQRGRLKLVVGLARLMAPSLGLAQTNQNRGRQRSKHVFQTRSQFLPLQPSRVMSLSSRKMDADSYRNQLAKNKDCSQRYFIFLRFFRQLPAIAPPNTSKPPFAIDFDRGSGWEDLAGDGRQFDRFEQMLVAERARDPFSSRLN
jgi:hypothetical protein